MTGEDYLLQTVTDALHVAKNGLTGKVRIGGMLTDYGKKQISVMIDGKPIMLTIKGTD